MNTIQTLAITWPEFMDALTYQLTGMIVVFCCLSMLCIILSISGAVAVRLDAKKKAAAEAAKAALAAAAPVAAAPVATPEPTPAQVAALAAGIYDAAASSITPEVVAAIAAAVKVTVGNEAKILDIKPIDGSYAQSGRTSIMNSHNITRG
jgi:Na+-transporting methylmalonyl-CoA/oxaloacetate decarboxylase gamma subunit